MTTQTTKPLFFLLAKFFLLFSLGFYVLSLPYYYFKFGLVDGLNFFGYVSPPFVIQFEVIFCIVLSIIAISLSVYYYYQAFKFSQYLKKQKELSKQ